MKSYTLSLSHIMIVHKIYKICVLKLNLNIDSFKIIEKKHQFFSREKVNSALFNFHLKATKALLSRCPGVHVSVRNASKAQAVLCNILDAQISDIKQAGTWKDERVIFTRQTSEIGVIGRNDKLLNFCANNYLGLSVS